MDAFNREVNIPPLRFLSRSTIFQEPCDYFTDPFEQVRHTVTYSMFSRKFVHTVYYHLVSEKRVCQNASPCFKILHMLYLKGQ